MPEEAQRGDSPKASIIILTKDNEKHIEDSLRGVFSQEHHDYEVIVVDSGSTDKTVEIASNFPVSIKKLEAKKFSHGRARNMASSLARGKYLVFLSPDACPANEKWLEKLTTPLEDEEVAAVFARQIPKEGSNPVESYFLNQTYPARGKALSLRHLSEGDPSAIVRLSNVSSAIKRDVWEKFRFDEEIIISEDQEIARRILKSGHKIVYEPEAMVHHSHNYTLKDLFRRYFDSGESLIDIWESKTNVSKSMRYGLSLFSSTIRHLQQNVVDKKLYWIAYSLLYNMTKICGFFCGTKSKILPTFMVNELSHTRRHVLASG